MSRLELVNKIPAQYARENFAQILREIETKINLGIDGVWDDIICDAASAKASGANQPTWTAFRSTILAYQFAAATMNELHPAPIQIPHDYKLNSVLYPRFQWSQGNSVNTGVVRWGIEYTLAKSHGQAQFAASTTITFEHNISSAPTAYTHYLTSATDAASNTIAATSLEPDTLILMRVYRDAAHVNDTFPDPVFLFNAGVHYQRERLAGTRQRAPNFYT